VQTPSSAKFDGMPRSAIDAGLADVVDPPEELAVKILAYLHHVPLLVTRPDSKLADADQSDLEKIVLLLRMRTGHDFSLYKKGTIHRRIERRRGLHQIAKIADYVRYLHENSPEVDLLFKELLIGVTSFFRDPAVWEQLKTEGIPSLLAARPNGGTLRAWTPGCSTGEEAYSLAIVFRESLEQVKPTARYSLQVFATDLDKDAIAKARAGVYPANIAADVAEGRLHRFFVQEEHGHRVSKEIRDMVIFAPQNLVMDPPFTKLDLLMCRNLLIYLEADLQKKLLPLFHYSLNPEGILVLGSAESVGSATDLFAPLSGKTRLYRRQGAALRAELVEFPVAFAYAHAKMATALSPPLVQPVPNVQALTDHLLLQRYSPAAVLTTGKGDILYFSGKTGKYLELPAGEPNLNLFAMAREGLSVALNEAFYKAVRQKTEVTVLKVRLGTNGGTQIVDVTVQWLAEPEPLRGMVLIVFKDAATPLVPKASGKTERVSVHGARLAELSQELRQSRDELQTTNEKIQTSQ